MFPTSETVRPRGGTLTYATIGDGPLPVDSIFGYLNGNANYFFGATEDAIYDVTTVLDPTVSPSPAVSSLSNGDWSAIQFQTDGGVFLRVVNGEDQSQLFDGSSWTTTTIDDAADTGSDISSTFSFVWSWKQRLFFIEKESLNAWYLPVNQISGHATKLPLGGVFKRGGSLLFGGTWSQDTGSGLAVACVFVTTEGEAAVYQGTNPGDANAWSLVGVYRIGRPLGKNAWFQAGGDLVIATDVGLVPLSQAVANAKDFAALTQGSISWPINTAWQERVQRRNFAPWHCEIFPTGGMLLISQPSDADNPVEMLAANAVTGAWCGPYTGLHATCLEVYRDRAFYGSVGGRIVVMETTGSDDGAPYTATCVWQFDALGNPASAKNALQGSVTFLSQDTPQPLVFVLADFDTELPTAPDAPITDVSSIWGDAVWDEDVWAQADVARYPFSAWYSVSATGRTLAPGVRITSGAIAPPQTHILRFDLLFDTARLMS